MTVVVVVVGGCLGMGLGDEECGEVRGDVAQVVTVEV